MELATLRVYDMDIPVIRFYLAGDQSPLYAAPNYMFDMIIDESGYPRSEEAARFTEQIECYIPIEEGQTLSGLFQEKGPAVIKDLIVEVTEISTELL